MKTVEVSLTPPLIDQDALAGRITVVVDILRATSCMVTGLANGVKEMVPFVDKDECFKMREKGYKIAGERGGKKIKGFDLGNSPYDYLDDSLKGVGVAITTTNGTVAIQRSLNSEEVVIGAFLNISALSKYLLSAKKNIHIACAGWRGKVNLEDTLFAGDLISRLVPEYTPVGDSALIAQLALQSCESSLHREILFSDHAKRLGKEYTRDIELCTTIDKYPVIPIYESGYLILT